MENDTKKYKIQIVPGVYLYGYTKTFIDSSIRDIVTVTTDVTKAVQVTKTCSWLKHLIENEILKEMFLELSLKFIEVDE